MLENVRLSIIIPTYNSGAVIGRSLNSIVCQTFTDWEVLIMDGASSDNTVPVVQSFADDRIRIYSEPDNGIYDAMNKGIQQSRGEWLYFLGSDDWLLNENVFAEVFSDDIESFDVVYGEAEYSHLSDDFRGEWGRQNMFTNRCHQAIVYKKAFLEEVGGYNTDYKIYADFDLNLKWFLNKKYHNKYIGTAIAHFSAEGTSDGHTDLLFCKRQPLIYLTHGYWFMNNKQRAYCAFLAAKNTSGLKKCIYSMFSIFLRTVNKVSTLFVWKK